jgi:phosphohistidine swiveling domain-containing protein
MAANGRYILRLDELSRPDAPRAGAKAANLGELLTAGFTVPAGFVLTVEAFERFRTLNGFGPSTRLAEVAAAPLPDEVIKDLLAAHSTMPDAPLAVRSSGVAEDLPGASFAGQYETVLGVQGDADLLRAVSRCWSSAFSDRVAAYRAGRAGGGVSPMAVLVQLLVQADAAGVAFTVNPVTGSRDEVVVSAVRGLGERLVSGEVQPDEWFIRDGRAHCERAAEGAIGVDDVVRVADLARRVETRFGTAQDVEWALAGNELFLLQARPITALRNAAAKQVSVPAEVPRGFWQREATHFPRPLTPMMAGFMDLHNAAFREMFETYGLLLEGIEMQPIGGWIYARAVPLGGTDRKAPPAPLMWLLARSAPQLRDRIKACREAIRSDLHGRHIERWYAEWQPDLAQRIHALAAVDLGSLSDSELETHVALVEGLLDPCVRIHFLLQGAMVMILGEFAFTCRDLLGWDDRRMLELLNGLSEKSSEPSRRLAELARIASESAALRPMLERAERVDEATVGAVCAADEDFSEALAAYRRDYGCRALAYEFGEPNLGERPDFILGLVRDQLVGGYDPAADADALAEKRNVELAEARSALSGRASDLARFERALARAERAYPVREDSEFYTVSAPLGIFRSAALEVGRRLASRSQIDAVDDVFFLTMAEARGAVASSEARHDLVAMRRDERAWVLAHPGPASYGQDPGPAPAARALPGEARFAMEALQWVMLDRILAPEESQRRQPGGDRLSGIAAATGSYSGPVRVVMDETQFSNVRQGDVLVCPITSPVWSVLFPSIGALVTDTGGILSHAAIIAREYRLPAVVGTGNATQLLADGQLVTVDGDGGFVLTQENER